MSAGLGMSPQQWTNAALDEVKAFVAKNPKTEFMAHDVREFAVARGLPMASNEAVWGPVMAKASRAGIINKVGLGMRPSFGNTNAAPVSVWVAA
mgnify:CR=1 FL=1